MGGELEKRVKNLETIVKRLSRRSRKVASAMITPYPISNAVFGDNISGNILHYMFPCVGKITKGLILVGNKLENGAIVSISIKDDVHEESKSYVIVNKITLTNPNIDIDSGDRLTISIKPNDPEESITEVWMSFLWVPSMKEIDIKNFLIDKLESVSKETLPCPATQLEEGGID